MENNCDAEKPLLLGYGVGSSERSTVEAQGRVPQPKSAVRQTDGEVGQRGDGLGQADDATKTSQGRRDSQLARAHETDGGKEKGVQ